MRRAFATLGLLATGCSAVVPPPPPPPPPPEPVVEAVAAAPVETLSLAALEGGTWTAHDPESAWYRRYRFDGEHYRTDGFPTWQESGRVEVLASEGRQLRLRFVDRVYDGHEDEPLEDVIELAEDGGSFTMGGRRFVHDERLVVAADE